MAIFKLWHEKPIVGKKLISDVDKEDNIINKMISDFWF